jgi:hypothetical protein
MPHALLRKTSDRRGGARCATFSSERGRRSCMIWERENRALRMCHEWHVRSPVKHHGSVGNVESDSQHGVQVDDCRSRHCCARHAVSAPLPAQLRHVERTGGRHCAVSRRFAGSQPECRPLHVPPPPPAVRVRRRRRRRDARGGCGTWPCRVFGASAAGERVSWSESEIPPPLAALARFVASGAPISDALLR